MRFETLTRLRRLEVSFHQVHLLTELIFHPGCQLKIVDAYRVVNGTPRVTEEQTEKLIMALEKNKTIEVFYTQNEEFDMLCSPYVKRNLVYNQLMSTSVNIPAGLWLYLLELVAGSSSSWSCGIDAFYFVFRNGAHLFNGKVSILI